jgi:hypothetical protein
MELDSVADRPAVAAESLEPRATPLAADAPVPAGEGNIAEFFVSQTAPITGTTAASRAVIAGRVVVRLPAGEPRMLADITIKAYPAALLSGYLEKAKARRETEARRLVDLAIAAEKAGAMGEAQALIQRVRVVSGRTLDDLPVAPHATRSDEHGFFTLSHELADARLVAEGRVDGATGSWYFEWVGIEPKDEALLTENNATTITAPVAAAARYTAK